MEIFFKHIVGSTIKESWTQKGSEGQCEDVIASYVGIDKAKDILEVAVKHPNTEIRMSMASINDDAFISVEAQSKFEKMDIVRVTNGKLAVVLDETIRGVIVADFMIPQNIWTVTDMSAIALVPPSRLSHRELGEQFISLLSWCKKNLKPIDQCDIQDLTDSEIVVAPEEIADPFGEG